MQEDMGPIVMKNKNKSYWSYFFYQFAICISGAKASIFFLSRKDKVEYLPHLEFIQ